MTAAGAAATTPSGPSLHKRLAWKAFIGPSIAGLLAVVILGGKLLDKVGEDHADPNIAYSAAKQGAADVLAEVIPTTTEAPAPLGLDYDELSCSHAAPGDPTCTPFYPWRLTDAAQGMIGFQNGGGARQLNGANAHEVVVQLLRLRGVEPCSLLLSLKYDESGMRVLTVYRNKADAGPGSTELYDCSPRAGVTPGSIPTEGGA